MTEEALTRELMRCFKTPSTSHPDWFVIWDDEPNLELTKRFGIFSDSPIHQFKGMNVKFNWNTQIWMVQ